MNALHVPARSDQADAVDVLVEAGADVDLWSSTGYTPLFSAVHESCSKSTLALLRHGANVDVRNTNGNTPLHVACRERHKGVDTEVDLLFRWGADETPLNTAG